MACVVPNDERQPPEAAATRSRLHADNIGCLRLAARSGWAAYMSLHNLHAVEAVGVLSCGIKDRHIGTRTGNQGFDIEPLRLGK